MIRIVLSFTTALSLKLMHIKWWIVKCKQMWTLKFSCTENNGIKLLFNIQFVVYESLHVNLNKSWSAFVKWKLNYNEQIIQTSFMKLQIILNNNK